VAATPAIYRIVIDLTPKTQQTRSVASLHQKLRNLNGTAVTIKEPNQDGAKDQWTAHVIGLTEEAVAGTKSEEGWKVTLLVERYDWGS